MDPNETVFMHIICDYVYVIRAFLPSLPGGRRYTHPAGSQVTAGLSPRSETTPLYTRTTTHNAVYKLEVATLRQAHHIRGSSSASVRDLGR